MATGKPTVQPVIIVKDSGGLKERQTIVVRLEGKSGARLLSYDAPNGILEFDTGIPYSPGHSKVVCGGKDETRFPVKIPVA